MMSSGTWESRLLDAFGPGGYETCMRRSLQTVILYEANRCVASALPALRPFQRKIAFIDMANALVDSLTIILPHHKAEILWRTGTSKEPMNADTAWKRRKLLNKEIDNIKEGVTALVAGRSHDEAVDQFIQQQFEAVTSNNCPVPRNWCHAHNNAFMCYRMYFRGNEPDPTFPPPNPPKPIYVAAEKLPAIMYNAPPEQATPVPSLASIPNSATKLRPAPKTVLLPDDKKRSVGADDRRLMLNEVREHMELLKEFEGIIPDEELVKRKQELFLAMPPAPPPAKRAKKVEEAV